MGARSPSQDTFVVDFDAEVTRAYKDAGPDVPAKLRAAIALCEERKHELSDRTIDTVERHGVRFDVPISKMPPAAQTEIRPLADCANHVRWRLSDLQDELPRHEPDEHGCFTLGDGNSARVLPDGRVISGISGLASWQEPDESGNLVTHTSDGPSEQTLERHRGAVLTFKRSRQYRQEIRRLRAPRARATGRARQRGAGRPARRHLDRARRAATPAQTATQETPRSARRGSSGRR